MTGPVLDFLRLLQKTVPEAFHVDVPSNCTDLLVYKLSKALSGCGLQVCLRRTNTFYTHVSNTLADAQPEGPVHAIYVHCTNNAGAEIHTSGP